MQRHFDDELNDLKNQLLRMGGLAEKMAAEAIKGLVERDDFSAAVFAHEEAVNRLQIDIDECVVRLIALHHPVASDLRFLVMATRIGGELERIGDLAVNIAETTTHYLQHPPLTPMVDLPAMAELACAMLRDSLDAFTNGNVELAQKVLETDNECDAFKDRIFRELLAIATAEPTKIVQGFELVLVSRNLERIGDHATNIAEEAIFVAQGREVRHHFENQAPPPTQP